MMELINALINRAPMSALINDVRLRQKVAKQLKGLSFFRLPPVFFCCEYIFISKVFSAPKYL